MATTKKKKSNGKKPQPQKKGGKSAKGGAETASARSQITAVLLFAVSVFIFCVMIIRGEKLWSAMNKFALGVFGVWGYILPVLLCITAVMTAKNKIADARPKIIESFLTLWFVSAFHEVLYLAINDLSTEISGFGNNISHMYALGNRGAGFFGSLLGYPFACLFGKTGAIIIFALLIFVFLMLMTGTTLISFFRGAYKPIEKVKTAAENAYVERHNEPTEESMPPRFDIDVPIDEEDEKRRLGKKSIKDRQKELIDKYNGVPSSEIAGSNGGTAETSENPETDAPKPDIIPEEVRAGIIDKINQQSDEEDHSFTPPEQVENTADNGAEEEKEEYVFPPITKLAAPKAENNKEVASELENTASLLVNTLRSFGVETRITDISRGPAVTRYELQPSAGVKISKITNLADDIALNLASAGVRIEAPIPNKAAVGIEVPNKTVSIVRVREIIDSPTFINAKSKLTVALGKDIGGEVAVADIAKMPHGLIAGATGSGKSVCINSFLISLLYKATPEDVKLLLIDPKVVELGIYNGIPHLLVPVVTDPRKAAGALGWAVTEMERRYKLFAENEVRNLEGYNRLAAKHEDLQSMPHIVIIIDELADLMMTAPGEVEGDICRIAQKARAAGMHLIIATQRPSVNVVTGLIKANVPSRIAFSVSSQIDSRTILDMGGAEKLLGRGDMLFFPVGAAKPHRVQGCYVSDEEVEEVVDFIKNSGKRHEYDEEVMLEIEHQAAKEKAATTGLPEDQVSDYDPMIEDAIRVVADAGQASTSLLQRKLKLGYSRAARIMDQMEERGVIGPYEGSKPRKVLISREQIENSGNSENTD